MPARHVPTFQAFTMTLFKARDLSFSCLHFKNLNSKARGTAQGARVPAWQAGGPGSSASRHLRAASWEQLLRSSCLLGAGHTQQHHRG